MGLWERTTHNSKELLSFLFEYYFDLDYMIYKENDGKVLGAFCCIPYSFGFGANKLKGLYVIALSSEEGYRKKGILSELVDSLNQKVSGSFDFTFIVPSTQLLADFYSTQGYFSSFFILEERFTPLHDFRNDYFLSLTDSDERIKELKIGLIDEIRVRQYDRENLTEKEDIKRFILEMEKKGSSSVNLCHTPKDLDYILSDLSIRPPGCFIAYDSDGKISGVAFTQKEEMKRIRVIAMYSDDSCSYYALLQNIKNSYPEHSISVNTPDPKNPNYSLISYTYAAANPAGGDLDNTFGVVEIPFNINKLLQPLGMVNLLRYDKIIQYIAETRSDVDFKLYIRDLLAKEDTKDKENPVFIVKNGKFQKVKYGDCKKDSSLVSLSKKELSELLLRKPDSSNLIMEAFGIPRLDLQMLLLPY